MRSWRSALLEDGAGEPSVVKAYQLLRAIMNTALDDELIQRNPCRIKGTDTYDVPERPVLSVTECSPSPRRSDRAGGPWSC
ncbi:hypothetical protein ABTX81_18180 [Kitasatospora sp. NPDC097605]|uniref:hypothetical protein n=1 Tax=Kitasatospora sp. NPDC097605 TaxID=3157226 RepID=UPI00331C22B6